MKSRIRIFLPLILAVGGCDPAEQAGEAGATNTPDAASAESTAGSESSADSSFAVAPKPDTVNFDAGKSEPDYVWVEGEDAAESSARRHGWYDSVVKDELSGGEWLSNFGSPEPALARYPVEVPSNGDYEFWVRANPTGSSLAYRVDGGEWSPIDTGPARQQKNLAADGKPDIRYVAWIPAGTLALDAGTRTIEFRMDSKNQNHGAIDAFVLSRDPFLPNEKLKPGQTTGRAESGKWAFEPAPDPLADGALLDLRYLNETPAGKHGFVRLAEDGESFVDGRGRPLRFWSGTSYVFRDGASVEDVQRWGEFHAKRGVNMVRFHGNLSGKGGDFGAIDEDQLDGAWKLVAGMKRAGIYTSISPYWGSHTQVPENWDGPHPDNRSMTGMLFFDPATQEAYKGWLRELLTRENPYTGVPLKDEPAVAILQIQNEDSLLFWTEQDIQGEARRLLGRQFAEFAKKKYGSLDEASEAWGGAEMDQDDLAAGVLGLFPIWHQTQPGGRRKARLADQLEFYAETMRSFNEMIERYVRDELGAPQLINAGNWKTADNIQLLDVERYSYTANEVAAVNSYVGTAHVGEGSGHSIRVGHRFTNGSALKDFDMLATNIKQPAGMPMIISESLWVPPNRYQSEGPLAVAAYQSLTGIDSFFWFTIGRGYDSGLGKWSASTPAQLGMFPAAALMFRNFYLEQGETVVHERRRLDDLWQRRSTVIAEQPGFDPNRDVTELPPESPVTSGVDPRAFLVGPVKVSYDADPAETEIADLAPHIDDDAGVVRGNTGQVALDTARGVLRVDAPRAQAAAGFLGEASPIELGDVRIRSGNEYAAVHVVSLDAAELAASGNVLVQAATTVRPYGFETKPAKIERDGESRDGLEITSLGSSPLNLELNDIEIEIDNPALTKAYVLDANGFAVREHPLESTDTGVRLSFPEDAIYVVLRSE